jgi:uncharacterized protein
MMKKIAFLSSLALAAMYFAQDKPAAEAAKPEAAAPAAAAGGDTAKVVLGVLPAVMKFDKTEFSVKPGQKVMLLFKNDKCPLQHNVIICKPGTKATMIAEATKFMADPNALKANYIPTSADILFKSTKLVGMGQTDLIEFTAPADEGEYPYLCTFPGHAAIMNGVMKVAK